MNLYVTVNNKLHARQAHTIIGDLGEGKGLFRMPRFIMISVFGRRRSLRLTFFHMKRENTFIHQTLITLGTAYRHFLSRMDLFRGIASTNHRRDTQFTADNSCMAGSYHPCY